ncbi:MAG: hypothetical protein ACLGH3_00385 [Actinomycetota bacterium]
MPEDKRRSGSSRSTSKKTATKKTAAKRSTTGKAAAAKRSTSSGAAKRPTTGKAGAAKAGSSRSAAAKRSTARKKAGSKGSSTTRKTSASKGSSTRGRSASNRDDLQPLDLEGTDFEGLLDPSADLDPDEDDLDDQLDDEDLDDDDDDDLDDEDADGIADEIVPAPGGAPGVIRWNPPGDSDDDGAATGGLPPIPPVGPGEAPFEPLAHASDEDEPVRTRDEALVALLGVLLAGSTLLPWYSIGSRQITGLGSGSFGPVVFVAGIGAAIIAGARLLGKRLRFPLERGLVLEILGYLAAGSVILKRFIKPLPDIGVEGTNTVIALVLAIALAFLSSRLSSGAPLMIRPGWRREKGGQAGAGLLATLLLAAVALAIVQPGKLNTGANRQNPIQYSSTPPECSTSVDFPVPAVLKEVQYFRAEYQSEFAGPGTSACGGIAQASQTPKNIAQRFQKLLKDNGWNFEAPSNRGGVTLIVLRKPRCGTVSASRPGGGTGTPTTQVNWNFTVCAAQGGTPPN